MYFIPVPPLIDRMADVQIDICVKESWQANVP
jgi:hypothetical protein